MKRLQNKNILLTAAAQGIGHTSLLRFLEEGATVWATDINLKPLEALNHSEQQVKVRKLDVCDPHEIEKLIEEIKTNDDFKMINSPFTYIKQSIGIKKGTPEILDFLNKFITKLIKEGYVESLLKKHNIQNKLSIPNIY